MPVSSHTTDWYSKPDCSVPWLISGWYGVYAVANSERPLRYAAMAGIERRYAPAPRKSGRDGATLTAARCSSSAINSGSVSAGGSSIAGSRSAAGRSSNSASTSATPTRASIRARSAAVAGM